MNELFWPDEELRRFLANGSRAYNLYTSDEGIEQFIDQIKTVFEAEQRPETS